MANELRAISTLNFSAPQLAHSKLRGACLNLASAPTDERAERFYRHFDFKPFQQTPLRLCLPMGRIANCSPSGFP